MTIRNEAKWIAILFAGIAAGLLIAAIWIPYRTPPLSFQPRLTSDYTLERDFRLSRKGNYRVSVYCSTPGDIEHLRDLLKGGNLVKITVNDGGVPLDLYYFSEPSPTNDWGNIASGPARNELGQDIADFAAERDKLYHIKCSVIRPVPELDMMSPTLVIWLDPLDAKGDGVLSGFLLLGAIGAALLAGIALVTYLLARKKNVPYVA